jgi:hypothetical protein
MDNANAIATARQVRDALDAALARWEAAVAAGEPLPDLPAVTLDVQPVIMPSASVTEAVAASAAARERFEAQTQTARAAAIVLGIAAEIAAKLGRGMPAVRNRAIALGLGPWRGELLATKAAEVYSGWSRLAIARAAAALGIEPRRHALTDPRLARRAYAWLLWRIEDVDRMAEWLAENGKPSPMFGPDGSFPSCKACGRSGVLHVAKGFCRTCYNADRYRRLGHA